MNDYIRELDESNPLRQWYRITANLLFLSLAYQLVNIFPMTCIYIESQRNVSEVDEASNQGNSDVIAAEVISKLKKY